MEKTIACAKPNKLLAVASSFPVKNEAETCRIKSDYGTIESRVKRAVVQIPRLVFWCVCSAVLVLLAMSGLYALAPVDYQPPQSKFFISVFLLLLFWLAWVALIVSINCSICIKFLSHDRKRNPPRKTDQPVGSHAE